MSEFKFSCPVCGQHIAADSSASGALIECPTCFQRIIVPQASRPDSRYILSATQYIKPPPIPSPPPPPVGGVSPPKSVAPAVFAVLVLVCVGAAVIYMVRRSGGRSGATETASGPTNEADRAHFTALWNLNLAGAVYPKGHAAGRIHDGEFNCQRAFVQNGSLALHQGPGYKPEMIVNVLLPANGPQELEGKPFNVGINQTGVTPQIVLLWKEDNLQVTQSFTSGYAMKLEFGQVAADKLPGRIYLCLPDVSKSFVAGTFSAEIRKPPVPGLR